MEKSLLTTIELAKRLAKDRVINLRPQTINAWVGRENYPQPERRSQKPGQAHYWLYTQVLKWFAEKDVTSHSGMDEREARRRKLAADALSAEIDLAVKQGQFARIDDITAQWGQMIVAAKSRLLGMGHKLAPAIAIESDPVTCLALINAEVHEAMSELGRYDPRKKTAKPRRAPEVER
jgi:hypothetical protein